MNQFVKFMKNLFELDRFEFEELEIKKEVVEQICNYSKSSYPREFFALLQGQIKERKLIITSLVYQQYQSSKSSAVYRLDLPLIHDCYGSVHSHPSGRNSPSLADLRSFNKNGVVHFIIGSPYTIDSLKAFNFNGAQIKYSIVE